MLRPQDVAHIEQWAVSAYPDRGAGASVVVRARGTQVNVIEESPHPGGVRSRSIVRLRYLPDRDLWRVHRLLGGGRWLERRPEDGPLADVLAAIDLERLPA